MSIVDSKNSTKSLVKIFANKFSRENNNTFSVDEKILDKLWMNTPSFNINMSDFTNTLKLGLSIFSCKSKISTREFTVSLIYKSMPTPLRSIFNSTWSFQNKCDIFQVIPNKFVCLWDNFLQSEYKQSTQSAALKVLAYPLDVCIMRSLCLKSSEQKEFLTLMKNINPVAFSVSILQAIIKKFIFVEVDSNCKTNHVNQTISANSASLISSLAIIPLVNLQHDLTINNKCFSFKTLIKNISQFSPNNLTEFNKTLSSVLQKGFRGAGPLIIRDAAWISIFTYLNELGNNLAKEKIEPENYHKLIIACISGALACISSVPIARIHSKTLKEKWSLKETILNLSNLTKLPVRKTLQILYGPATILISFRLGLTAMDLTDARIAKEKQLLNSPF